MEIDKLFALEKRVQDTVGYSESSDRDEFMKGARIGIAKAVDVFETHVKALNIRLKNSEAYCCELKADLKTLVRILDRYREET